MPAYNADQILARYWNQSVPVDPVRIAKNMGADVYQSESLEFDGEFLIRENVPTILYRPSGNSKRDRFTIAHELGHFALNHGNAHRDTIHNFGINNFIPIERDANSFAAELLMPEEMIRLAVLELRMASIYELASSFDVSNMAMDIRLENLGYYR